MGAAVDSVVWNNKEFINAWDHGRELQTAVSLAQIVLIMPNCTQSNLS
jgi:hypothetical protein